MGHHSYLGAGARRVLGLRVSHVAESASMIEARKKPGMAFWATVVVVVVLLYPLSFGPAVWLAARGACLKQSLNGLTGPCSASVFTCRMGWEPRSDGTGRLEFRAERVPPSRLKTLKGTRSWHLSAATLHPIEGNPARPPVA